MSISSVTYCLKEENLKRNYYHQMKILRSSMWSERISSVLFEGVQRTPWLDTCTWHGWRCLQHAPDSVLDFVNCKYKTGCINNRCFCKKANLKCSELCNCSNCQNGANGDTDTIEHVYFDDTYDPVDSASSVIEF
jgi:hypothetical protein